MAMMKAKRERMVKISSIKYSNVRAQKKGEMRLIKKLPGKALS